MWLQRPHESWKRADLSGRAKPLPTSLPWRKYRILTTVARLGSYALAFRATRAVSRVAAALALAMALAGCRGHEDAPRVSSAARSPISQGRPIGAAAGERASAIAASVHFVRGYLSFQAGRLLAEQVPGISEELRAALKRLRVPPTSRSRQAKIVGAQLERIDARSARVTVQVRNVDERLTYPLPIDLVRRDGRWAVLSAGDDT